MNYYEILEVSTNASKEVIKNAYRALIKKYHPDSYTGDKEFAQEKVKEINEAYETITDDDKRLLYDYDNGFKIDPNAPKEEEQITVTCETEEQKVKQEEKSKFDIRSFLKNKKAVVFSVIVLFICAFSIGLIIAGKTGEDVDNNKDTTNEVVENKTVDKEYHENNNTYKQNNKTDTNTNTTTKVEDNKTNNDNKQNTIPKDNTVDKNDQNNSSDDNTGGIS